MWGGFFINDVENKLKRHLNLFSLCVFGIGTIIGAGIYSVIGVAFGHAEGSLWISFLLAGIAAILTALSYCELATMYPSAGAEYVYLRAAFPKTLYPSFIISMIILVAGAATAATVAKAFSGYLQYFFPANHELSAFILIFVASSINLLGIKSSNWANILFTFVEIVGIMIVIWFGVTINNPIGVAKFSMHRGTYIATSLIFFVYLGFEEIANLAEEVKNPHKNIPRAILLSLFVTTILYVAVSFSVIRLIEAKDLAKSHFPLAVVLVNIAPKMEKVLCAIALFSTANTVLVALLVLSRMLFSVSRGKDLPAFIGVTNKKFSTPHIATMIACIGSGLFLFINDLEILAGLSSFATLLAFISVNFSVIRLRYSQPNLERVFKSPLNFGRFPILSGLGVLITAIMCFQFSAPVYFVTGSAFFLGTLYYFSGYNKLK